MADFGLLMSNINSFFLGSLETDILNIPFILHMCECLYLDVM